MTEPVHAFIQGRTLDIVNGGHVLRKLIFATARRTYALYRSSGGFSFDTLPDTLSMNFSGIKIFHSCMGFVLYCDDSDLHRELSPFFNQIKLVGASTEEFKYRFVSTAFSAYIKSVNRFVLRALQNLHELSHLDLAEVDTVHFMTKEQVFPGRESPETETLTMPLECLYKYNIHSTIESRSRLLSKFLWSNIRKEEAALAFGVFGFQFNIGEFNFMRHNRRTLEKLKSENRFLINWVKYFCMKKGFQLDDRFFSLLKKHLKDSGVRSGYWRRLCQGGFRWTTIAHLPSWNVCVSDYLHMLVISHSFRPSVIMGKIVPEFKKVVWIAPDPKGLSNFFVLTKMLNDHVGKSWTKAAQEEFFSYHYHQLNDYVISENITLDTHQSFKVLMGKSTKWHENLNLTVSGSMDSEPFHQAEVTEGSVGEIMFLLLNSAKELVEEGERMMHCVGDPGFIKGCRAGLVRIYHVTYQDIEATLEVYRSSIEARSKWYCGQFFGKRNVAISAEPMQVAIQQWTAQLNRIELSVNTPD